jgi:hypothetical protein
MRAHLSRHRALPADLGLSVREFGILDALATPQQVQAFVTAIPANHELGGETVLCVRDVLQFRRAHCIEGAFVAACALWIHGEPPLLMHLDCAPCDYPHVVALYRRGRYWGAISKSNGSVLRFRDAVYRTLRELAMSYLHEYCDKEGRKTLRSYSAAFDLRRVDPASWLTNRDGCWATHDRLAAQRHYPLLTSSQARRLVPRDDMERGAALMEEYPRPARGAQPVRQRRKVAT